MAKDKLILVPQTLDDRLKELATLNQETTGVLLVRPVERSDLIRLYAASSYLTGRGERLEVTVDPVQQTIVDRFVREHPQYVQIPWHTHVTGNSRFSHSDLVHYREEISANKNFVALVITDEYRILTHRSNSGTSIKVVNDPEDFTARANLISRDFEDIRNSMGVETPMYQATRKA